MTKHFVRSQLIAPKPPLQNSSGLKQWLHENLFSSPLNSLLTLTSLFLLYMLIMPLISFGVSNAVWSGENRSVCLSPDQGACWAFVKAKFSLYIYGRYPIAERWRVDSVYFMGLAGLIPMLMPSIGYKKYNVIFLLAFFPVVAFILLTGGWFGLRSVDSSLWGGLLVTLIVAVTGIVASLPLGILLALGRQSKRPLLKASCVGFIEFWRGIPLITVLFMSSIMLPLLLPRGLNIDLLLRALIGVALFSSAYMAEVIRGGLQAIPKGQYEGAKALGLSYPKMMGLIILPQALKHVIPGIVNSFIALFKDTTLVLVIGLFDMLGMIQLSFTDANWIAPTVSHTGYLFGALVFWVFCFAMSRYSQFLEQSLNTERRG